MGRPNNVKGGNHAIFYISEVESTVQNVIQVIRIICNRNHASVQKNRFSELVNTSKLRTCNTEKMEESHCKPKIFKCDKFSVFTFI